MKDWTYPNLYKECGRKITQKQIAGVIRRTENTTARRLQEGRLSIQEKNAIYNVFFNDGTLSYNYLFEERR